MFVDHALRRWADSWGLFQGAEDLSGFQMSWVSGILAAKQHNRINLASLAASHEAKLLCGGGLDRDPVH